MSEVKGSEVNRYLLPEEEERTELQAGIIKAPYNPNIILGASPQQS